jgi:acetyltransferase-like isoleucine patch superfamily enzyme
MPVFDLRSQEIFRQAGVDHAIPLNSWINSSLEIEGPCSLKSISPQLELRISAFSYGVSGYFFNVDIGRYCSIGEAVQVGRHSHPLHYFSSSPFFYQDPTAVLGKDVSDEFFADFDWIHSFQRGSPPTLLKKTKIHNDVYIGHGAFIMPGITIGNGAVVGACSVVTKDVPDYAVFAGAPAKLIRMRFSDDDINKLLASKWWDYSPRQLIGIKCDSIDSIIDRIEKLRLDGAIPFEGPRIKFS